MIKTLEIDMEMGEKKIQTFHVCQKLRICIFID